MDIRELQNICNIEYGIQTAEIERSDESTDGNVYILKDVNKNRYVIKVYDNSKHANQMVKLHTMVNKIELKAPSIIMNKEEKQVTEHNDFFIVCYSFAEGVKLKLVELDAALIEAVARYLRSLHNITDNEFCLPAVPYKIRADRKSILHFDVTKQNIFVNGAEICFIDFDDAKFGPSVCDVAIALTNLFINRAKGADYDGMKLFIDSYYRDDINLKEQEMPLIKESAVKWLQSIIDNPNFESSTRAGLKNKLECWDKLKLD